MDVRSAITSGFGYSPITRLAMKTNSRTIILNGTTIELHDVEDALVPSAIRAFLGSTELDAKVDSLDVATRPLFTAYCIRAIRIYRARLAPHLGQRCVFDPSCSRYAELVLREYPIWLAMAKIVHRLLRCRPGHGGVDLPTSNHLQEGK